MYRYRQEKKKFNYPKFNKGVLIGISALCTVMVILSVVQRIGYTLIRTELPLMGVLLVLWALIVWGAFNLLRLFKSKMAKYVSGFVLGVLVFLIASVGLTYAQQFGSLLLPSEYTVIESPEGRKAVVMVSVDTGFESEEAAKASIARMDARRDAIAASGEEGEAMNEAGYPAGAYGYAYHVYPKVAGVFYHSKPDVEGAIYRGYESEAKILYEWIDADTLRLYLENPEIGDEGEVILKF